MSEVLEFAAGFLFGLLVAVVLHVWHRKLWFR
jgi:hypothetical protein